MSRSVRPPPLGVGHGNHFHYGFKGCRGPAGAVRGRYTSTPCPYVWPGRRWPRCACPAPSWQRGVHDGPAAGFGAAPGVTGDGPTRRERRTVGRLRLPLPSSLFPAITATGVSKCDALHALARRTQGPVRRRGLPGQHRLPEPWTRPSSFAPSSVTARRPGCARARESPPGPARTGGSRRPARNYAALPRTCGSAPASRSSRSREGSRRIRRRPWWGERVWPRWWVRSSPCPARRRGPP